MQETYFDYSTWSFASNWGKGVPGQNPDKKWYRSRPLGGGGSVLVAVVGPSPERGEGKILFSKINMFSKKCNAF